MLYVCQQKKVKRLTRKILKTLQKKLEINVTTYLKHNKQPLQIKKARTVPIISIRKTCLVS